MRGRARVRFQLQLEQEDDVALVGLGIELESWDRKLSWAAAERPRDLFHGWIGERA